METTKQVFGPDKAPSCTAPAGSIREVLKTTSAMALVYFGRNDCLNDCMMLLLSRRMDLIVVVIDYLGRILIKYFIRI